MELRIREFEELTTRELYEILKLRSQVFIVEQEGCYQDLDDLDYVSTHIYMVDTDGSCIGCLRVFLKEDEPGTVQLGRLVVRDRLRGLGRKLMEEGEKIARCRYHAHRVFLTGRRSARGFYEKCSYQISAPEDYTLENAPYFLFRKDL